MYPGLAQQMMDYGNKNVRIKKIIRRSGEKDLVIPMTHKVGEFVTIGWRFSQELLANLVDKSSIHCDHRFVRYRPAPVSSSSRRNVEQYKIPIQLFNHDRNLRVQLLSFSPPNFLSRLP